MVSNDERGPYSVAETKQILDYLSIIFSEARLVDPTECRELHFDPFDNLSAGSPCHSRWGLSSRCETCSGKQALATNTKHNRIDFRDNNVYWTLSYPMTVLQGNGTPRDCVIEATSYTSLEECMHLLSSNPSVSGKLLGKLGVYSKGETSSSEHQSDGDGAPLEIASTLAQILGASPLSVADPLGKWLQAFGQQEQEKPSEVFHFPMPLVGMAFVPGNAAAAVESIVDDSQRNLASMELAYLTCNFGQVEREAHALMEAHQDLSVRAAAGLLDSMSNAGNGHPVFATRSINETVAICRMGLSSAQNPRTKAACAFVDCALITLFGQNRSSTSPISGVLGQLPEGQRLFASYLVARQAFEQEDYGNSLGVIETALSYCDQAHPVPMAYLHTVAACDYMALMRIDEAKRAFYRAWELARPDGIFAPFVELYVQLQGLVDLCLKKDHPTQYRSISRMAQQFRTAMMALQESQLHASQIATLTASEMTVAALARRGWSNREIAAHLGLSENTVKHRMSFIYQKLHIRKRSDLPLFRLT